MKKMLPILDSLESNTKIFWSTLFELLPFLLLEIVLISIKYQSNFCIVGNHVSYAANECHREVFTCAKC